MNENVKRSKELFEEERKRLLEQFDSKKEIISESIQIENKNIQKGKKGEEVAIVFKDVVRKNDKVFLLQKRKV